MVPELGGGFDAALFTDLYELTMAAAFFREDVRGTATFSLFVRRLPPQRGFLVAAGLGGHRTPRGKRRSQ